MRTRRHPLLITAAITAALLAGCETEGADEIDDVDETGFDTTDDGLVDLDDDSGDGEPIDEDPDGTEGTDGDPDEG